MYPFFKNKIAESIFVIYVNLAIFENRPKNSY